MCYSIRMITRNSTQLPIGCTARSRKIREDYIAAPNKCRCCSASILPKEGSKLSETRIKRFCSSSCAAKYNNARKESRKIVNHCTCGKLISRNGKQCNSCAKLGPTGSYKSESLTKAELFKLRGSWQSARTEIRRVSERNFNNSGAEKVCYACGYTKHVQIAHMRAVSSFTDEALVSHICTVDNLRALCPNCHWEYDHGHLQLADN